MLQKTTPSLRFWRNVDKDGDIPSHVPALGPCWNWTAFTDKLGYGYFRVSREKVDRAYRFSWELHTQTPLEKGACVCHACDNPRCVRPSHLFLGTRADNNADKIRKGRDRKAVGEEHWSQLYPEKWRRLCSGLKPPAPRHGELNNKAKLTKDQILLIRQQHALGLTKTEIGRQFGVTRSAIYYIIAGKTWRQVA